MPASEIQYSEKYFCKNYEYRFRVNYHYPRVFCEKCWKVTSIVKAIWRSGTYMNACKCRVTEAPTICSRHVILPADLARKVPRTHLMTETEWRNLGVQQSPGWIHFMIHDPEPHVLLFRRADGDYKNSVQWL